MVLLSYLTENGLNENAKNCQFFLVVNEHHIAIQNDLIFFSGEACHSSFFFKEERRKRVNELEIKLKINRIG